MLANGGGSWITGVEDSSRAVRSTISIAPDPRAVTNWSRTDMRAASCGRSGSRGGRRREASTRLAKSAVKHNRSYEQARAEGRDPGDRGWRAHRGGPRSRRRPAGHHRRARVHAELAASGGVAGGDAAEPLRRRGHLRLPRPRPVRRGVHARRPGGQGRRGRGGLRARAGLHPDRHRRVLHGRLDRAAARRAGRRGGRCRGGQQPGPLVLPRHQADAAGALRHRAPGGPVRRPQLPATPGSAAAGGTRCRCRPPMPPPGSRPSRC